jgi:hypothetical protein
MRADAPFGYDRDGAREASAYEYLNQLRMVQGIDGWQVWG